MKKWILAAFGIILFAAGILPQASAAAQTPEPLQVKITQVDSSAFPKMKVFVSVTNGAGEPAPVNLSRILLREDGKTIQPDSVEGLGKSEPLTSLLVLDISGSMLYAGKLESEKAAATAYVDQMRPGDEAGILSFNTSFDYVQPFTPDHAKLLAAIDGLAAKHDTAMYDALVQGAKLMENVPGRRAIIVLTDGMDNHSAATSGELISAIEPIGLSISTIGLGEPSQQTATNAGLDEAGLRSLAERAGGSYGYVNDAAGLQALFEQYGRALQSEYVISYTSPSALRNGINRSLSVELSSVIPAVPASGTYNPGGLVPEVASGNSWPLFLVLLAVLLAMLFVPRGYGLAKSFLQKRNGLPAPAKEGKATPLIRLNEPKAPRIKLH